MGGLSATVTDATTSVIPPPPTGVVYHNGTYDPEKDALGDITGIRYALELFLSSHMVESENFCQEMDPAKYVSAYSIPTAKSVPLSDGSTYRTSVARIGNVFTTPRDWASSNVSRLLCRTKTR